MFLRLYRLYHNININKRALERRFSCYLFRRRGFSNITVNELKNVKEPASMRGYRGFDIH